MISSFGGSSAMITVLLAILGATWRLSSVMSGIQHDIGDIKRRLDVLEQ